MKYRIFPAFVLATLLGVFSIAYIQPIHAATPTPTVTSSAVSDAEVEREKLLVKELSLNIPDQTEDPNYPVTFIDPSKQGVEISVDDKPATKVPNPYLLPNLSIGEHKLIFKFKNKDGIVRVLTKYILVTPKAPQFDATLKTEVVKPNAVTLKGTALPMSTVLLVVNSQDTHKITANSEGKWEFILPAPEIGTNNIIAFAIKEGIVSSPSKSFAVQYKISDNAANANAGTVSQENKVIAFAKQLLANINTNRVEQPAIFYGVIGGAVIVILLLLELQLKKRAAKQRDEKTIATLFGTLQKEGGTIVEAIQSVKDSVTRKKKKNTPEIEKPESAPVQPPTPVVDKKEVSSNPKTTLVKNKTKKVKKTPITDVVSEPLQEEKTVEEVSVETEEPEKKVLTKEEFLKQFQKGGEQDE
jgi:hypothetical protein